MPQSKLVTATRAFFKRHPGDLENYALRDGVSFAIDEDGMVTLNVRFAIDANTAAEFLNPAEPE